MAPLEGGGEPSAETEPASTEFDHRRLTSTLPTTLPASETTSISYSGHDPSYTGTIPTEFGLLTAVTEMSLSENEIKGAIPTEFGLLSAVAKMSLSNNKIDGKIPTQLGLMTELSSGIDVDGFLAKNALTSTIPTEFGKFHA